MSRPVLLLCQVLVAVVALGLWHLLTSVPGRLV
jgi:NitT/TauT family transport system permease protein